MLPFEGCNVGAILSCCKEAVKLFQLGPLCRICNENDEARRLGVPHLWPSRVKVFFLAILTSVFNFSVFQYLHNANVAYLNLSSPSSNEIVCKLPRERCCLCCRSRNKPLDAYVSHRTQLLPSKEECASNPDPARCTVDLEDRRFWRGQCAM
eukprot:s2476_g14.t1